VDLLRFAVAEQLGQGGAMNLLLALQQLELQDPPSHRAQRRLEALTPPQRDLAALLALFVEGLPREQVSLLLPQATRVELEALVMQNLVRENEQGRFELVAQTLGPALLSTQNLAVKQNWGKQGLAFLREQGTSASSLGMLLLRSGLASQYPALVLSGARTARWELRWSESVLLYRTALAEAQQSNTSCSVAYEELAEVYLTLGQYQRAIDLWLEVLAHQPPEISPARTRGLLSDALVKAGRAGEALAYLAAAAPEGLMDQALRAQQSKVLLFAGHYENALALARQVTAEAGTAHYVEALHVQALSQYYRGQLTEALTLLESALSALPPSENSMLRTKVLNSKALVHQRRAEFDAARHCYEQCLDQARTMHHLPFESTFLMNLASVFQQRAEYGTALDYYQQSLHVAQQFGGLREMAQVLHNLGRLYALLGQQVQADAALTRSSALCQGLEWTTLQAENWLVAGEIALESGLMTEARRQITRAEEVFRLQADQRGELECQCARAKWLLKSQSAEEALTQARSIDQACGDMTSIQLRAHLIAGEAELARAGGAPREALTFLGSALRLAEEAKDREMLVEIHLLLGQTYGQLGDPAEAKVQRGIARLLLQQQLDQLPATLQEDFLRHPLRQALVAESTPSMASGSVVLAAPGADPSSSLTSFSQNLLQALLNINKELNEEPDLKRLLERIIDHAVDLAGAERGFLLMKRAQQQELEIQVARNIDQEAIRKKEFKISRSIAEDVLASGKPLIAVDAMDDSRFAEFLSVHNLRLRSVLCVPLVVRRQVRGAIYLDNRFASKAFHQQHLQLLEALADQAALAIGNWELRQQDRQRQQELEQNREELQRLNAQLEQTLTQQSQQLDELALLARHQKTELQERYHFENFVGQSAAMRDVFRLIDRVKDSPASIFIYGESGTGKELVAKALHYNSALAQGPFISANCGAIPATLLESELFGFEKGAFTGAHKQRRGFIERSDGGSLFLDEVGDMPTDLQVKLLRVLQEHTFMRIGGEVELRSTFRLISASNRDLQALVKQGTFREDLYYRLNVITIRLPPLRDRREDIPLLISFLLNKHGAKDLTISKAAMRQLLEYSWPGNVRELENELLRMHALAGPQINPEDLSPHLQARSMATPISLAPHDLSLKDALLQAEYRAVCCALKSCQGNVTEAAKHLGMTRVGLHKLMRRHGIDRKSVSWEIHK
jgi:serine/threonine-protein kinase PknK